MCITSRKAHLSQTKILSLPLENGNHFIAYGNSAKNESGKPNAMILPIPGRTKPEWFHNTAKYKSFLNDIVKEATLSNWLGLRSRSLKAKSLKGDSFGSYEKFQLGMYTVGLADSFDGIAAFLVSLSDEERPEIGEELQQFFRNHYKDWSFAVCCFSSNKTIDAQPIAFEYTPIDPNLIYFPTMDAHDGGAPKLDEEVDVDHTFIFEHTGPREKKYAMEHIELDDVPDFLNRKKYRITPIYEFEQNGDTVVRIDELNTVEFSKDPEFVRSANIFEKP